MVKTDVEDIKNYLKQVRRMSKNIEDLSLEIILNKLKLGTDQSLEEYNKLKQEISALEKKRRSEQANREFFLLNLRLLVSGYLEVRIGYDVDLDLVKVARDALSKWGISEIKDVDAFFTHLDNFVRRVHVRTMTPKRVSRRSRTISRRNKPR